MCYCVEGEYGYVCVFVVNCGFVDGDCVVVFWDFVVECLVDEFWFYEDDWVGVVDGGDE